MGKVTNGMGGLNAPTIIAMGQRPSAIVAMDFDGNDTMDLVVTNELSSSLSVVVNNGVGAFSYPRHYPSKTPIGMAAADFDRNGFIDFAVVDGFGGKLSLLLGGCWP